MSDSSDSRKYQPSDILRVFNCPSSIVNIPDDMRAEEQNKSLSKGFLEGKFVGADGCNGERILVEGVDYVVDAYGIKRHPITLLEIDSEDNVEIESMRKTYKP